MTAMPFSTKLGNIQVNKCVFRYYSELPKNYRLPTITDFLRQGRRKIGMAFLILWD